MTKDLQASPKINPAESIHPKNVIIQMPGHEIPSYRVFKAFENKVAHNFLINTWGGLGDQICAEPAIRFALEIFKKCDVSLASRCPSLFDHLKFKDVFDTRIVNPHWDNYLMFQTILPPSTLIWEFLSHMLCHQVDFPSICMFRCQLPLASREIKMPDFSVTDKILTAVSLGHKGIVIHPGKHWQSKTFSKEFWLETIKEFQAVGFTPIIIGHEVDENVGYVHFDAPEGCLDLRDQLDIKEFITLLKHCKYLFSNDSAPIHAASAGDAYIGVIATCKHPDFILHWRKGQFSWNAKNYGRDGIWNHVDYSPAQETVVSAEELPEGLMEAILPRPKDVAIDFADRRDLTLANLTRMRGHL